MSVQIEQDAPDTAGSMERVYELARKLRFPGGCPWDAAQTPLSMRQYIIEECFELIDALTNEDAGNACEELGDLFYNLMLTAVMFEQSNVFSVKDVMNGVCGKLVRRHPHVFNEDDGSNDDAEGRSLDKVNSRWDFIKENVERRKKDSALDEVPSGFPPILKSRKYLSKAAGRGFEWSDDSAARDKIQEELSELDEAVSALKKALADSGDKNPALPAVASAREEFLSAEEEAGDLILSVINFLRMNGIDAAVALEKANVKFYRRFTFVEQEMRRCGIPMDAEHRARMLEFWRKAKSAP